MTGPVSFETMVTFVQGEINKVVAAMEHLGRELDRHQEWHRGSLEEQLRNRTSNGWQLVQQVFSLLTLIIAVVALVYGITHHH